MKFPVFDLHCDTASFLIDRGNKKADFLRENTHHIDLSRGQLLDGYAQCFAVFTTTEFKLPCGLTPQDVFWREVSALLDQIDKNKDIIHLAKSASDIEKNRKDGFLSAVLTVEGAAGIGFDPEKLEKLHNIGFRISSLGWNEKNVLTGSNVTGGGLTARGREYVKEAQRQGILVDVSHISDEAFWDIIKMTQAPIIATHSNSRAVCNVSRNLTDDMFRAICQTGGVAGLNQFTLFLGENATLDTACDHIFHFMELDPEGRHIALGGDLDGCDDLPSGFTGVQDYPLLAQRLLQRGLDEKTVQNIFWNNALRVLGD